MKALEGQRFHTFLSGHRVFHNPVSGNPWETSQQLRRTVWMRLLKQADVRYRNPYQTRHTYASMMLSQGENIMWLSKQMGHADAQVTLRKYARWLPDSRVKGGYQLHHDWQNYLEAMPNVAG
ncbi:MAG: tyrosine-type recombinase/integrase [Pseudomonadota bacterium]